MWHVKKQKAYSKFYFENEAAAMHKPVTRMSEEHKNIN
jgi:hypothetical protein